MATFGDWESSSGERYEVWNNKQPADMSNEVRGKVGGSWREGSETTIVHPAKASFGIPMVTL